MNKIFVVTALMLLASMTSKAASYQVKSPNGQLVLVAGVDKGHPYYKLFRNGQEVVGKSFLGLKLSNADLSQGFKVSRQERNTKDETWEQPWGEDKKIRNHYNGIKLSLRQTKTLPLAMQIEFRVFDDGVGFRYLLPHQAHLSQIILKDELTEFCLPKDVPAWSIPTNHTSYYEGLYKKSLLSQKDTVCTPLTIEAGDSLYMAIHQAAMIDYADLNLTPVKNNNGQGVKMISALTPWQDGNKVYAEGSLTSPWRTIIVAKRATDLMTSRLMLNLNESNKLGDISWIKPGRYIGIWWNIHMKNNTWEMGAKHGATTANMLRYIDFAAQHGFQGVLAEGWNYGWGQGEKISYLKNYPDYEIEKICQYAKEKGVSIIGHMETWGATKLLENQMDSAFTWFNKLGINTVKTGYVGTMLDQKELQHSQYGIRHYLKVVKAAARHHIMIDNHEPAMPTGLQRTYPNLMTQEGVRGQEYNAWSPDGGNPPEHTVTLPFTRGLAGPMDFTPGLFKLSNDAMPKTHAQSTLARQLAEFVVLYSPLQMAADAIENYEGQPALSFIESCPTTWEKTIVPNGEIGKYITVARQERGGGRWVVGCMTDREERTLSFKLDFLDAGKKYRAIIYEDGPDANYQTNPYPMTIRQVEVDSTNEMTIKLAPGGGAVVRIEKI